MHKSILKCDMFWRGIPKLLHELSFLFALLIECSYNRRRWHYYSRNVRKRRDRIRIVCSFQLRSWSSDQPRLWYIENLSCTLRRGHIRLHWWSLYESIFGRAQSMRGSGSLIHEYTANWIQAIFGRPQPGRLTKFLGDGPIRVTEARIIISAKQWLFLRS